MPQISSIKPGEEPSPGFVGASPEQVRERWSEESLHSLAEPGAYEWWYFHALSPAGDGILLSLFQGLPFHPKYLTQINRFQHRLGGSKPWPGLEASRYPAAYLAVYEGGKRIAQFLNLYPPDSSQASPTDIRVGPNRITLRHDGSFGITARGYPYELSRGRPKKRHDLVLSTSLSFAPTFPGVQHTRPFRAPDRSGATHHWILTAPHGRMTGNAQLLDSATQTANFQIDVDTLGYHDHVYGQGGLGSGVKTLLWGFIQGDHWTAAWHQSMAGSTTQKHADGIVFFEEGHAPVVIDAPQTQLSKTSFSNWLLRHPKRISMHGSDAHGHPLELILSHNAVLDTAPFHTHLAAQGTVTLPGRGSGALVGTGATHILKLQRLQWPVLSDLTLLAITPISRDDPIWSD
ncbi:MAG TPA: hypothetical protein VHM90_14735 [Phycisphaerae bacterium]|nr:hypothetical protein [Phycisphaerae bacterium]